MSVELFAVNISARLNAPIDDWLKYFSSERQEKILSYRFNEDRNRTIWAELLVRSVVAEKFSCPIEKVQVYRDAKGKPHIADLPVEISLSHAGNWVVCNVGTNLSGVDVEIDSTDTIEIAANFFLPGEYKKIPQIKGQTRFEQDILPRAPADMLRSVIGIAGKRIAGHHRFIHGDLLLPPPSGDRSSKPVRRTKPSRRSRLPDSEDGKRRTGRCHPPTTRRRTR